jgi:hypothetical protein
VLDFRDGRDVAACSDGRAVERCGGASEFKLALGGPILQECIEKAGVEDVSGAGGIRDIDIERG